jgi:hypothetical protein
MYIGILPPPSTGETPVGHMAETAIPRETAFFSGLLEHLPLAFGCGRPAASNREAISSPRPAEGETRNRSARRHLPTGGDYAMDMGVGAIAAKERRRVGRME